MSIISMTTIAMTTRAAICQAFAVWQMQTKPFLPTSRANPMTTVVGEYCWGTEKGINFPKVTQLVRTEPVNQPTAPLPGILPQIPGPSPRYPVSFSNSNNPGHFQSPRSLSQQNVSYKGSSEPDLNCSSSSSFCCKERKGIWKRNVSPAYLPCTQTQQE